MFVKADVEKYFMAEKTNGLLLLIVGAAAIIAALIFFLVIKTNFFKGAALTLLLLGMVQLVVGYTVYNRSDTQRKDIVYKMDLDPSAIQNKEIPRMRLMVNHFKTYMLVEVLLLTAATAFFVVYRQSQPMAFWNGLCIGLAFQAALLFAVDYIAASRAQVYLAGIESLFQH